MQNLRVVAAVVASCGVVASCLGQWTVVNLHPPGASESKAYAVRGGKQVGHATIDGVQRACMWTGTAASCTTFLPSGSVGSRAYTIDAGRVGGQAGLNGINRASVWNATTSAWTDLNLLGMLDSQVYDMEDGVQVGSAFLGGMTRAGLWAGNAASWIDLTPTGSTEAIALGIGDGRQVGYAILAEVPRASMWRASAASRVDLHPAGSSHSVLFDSASGQQVGRAFMAGRMRASLWAGSPGSWVDLHPAAAAGSDAYSVFGGQQVGMSVVNGGNHASLWVGTASSWVDLQLLLPPPYTQSFAQGVWNDGTNTYVVGWGRNGQTGTTAAMMWIGQICDLVSISSGPADLALLPGGTANLTCAAVGPSSAFQWRRDGLSLSDGSRYSGSQTSSLLISGFQPSDEGQYDCIVTGACNNAVTGSASLSCDPILTSVPPHRVYLDPGGVQLSVSVPAGASYTYRWRQDGQNLFNIPGVFGGVTTRTLSILSDDPSLEGVYDLVVTNACGQVVSSGAEVRKCFADYNDDGDVGTDADIEDFFACLGGQCCPACGGSDFNRDGDYGTDADIEAFFRVLAGGPC